MKTTLRGVSGAALVLGLIGAPGAWAQQAEQTVDQTPAAADTAPAPVDRIVITGQLIAGTSQDAPSPVEVYDLETLTNQGAPTASEFLRSLTISSESQGEADSQVLGAAAGFANVNLRGLGASRTLVLLNGRRFASTDGGAGADINTLPMMAVGRIDVLKDGASVTYGAGAVGGVINYMTRKNFEGFEIEVEKKMYDGSKGEDNISAMWGVQGDQSNLLVAGSYGKRNELGTVKRDFALQDYRDTPAIWTVWNSNPSNYYNQAAGYANIRDYTPDTCRAIGGELSGVLNNSLAPTASNFNDCAIYLPQFFNLIDEEEYIRGYLEYNSAVSDTMDFHFELSYAKTTNPNIKSGPSLPSGGVRATDTLRASLIGGFQVPYSQPTYNAAGQSTGQIFVNPFAEEFYNRAVANGLMSAAAPRGTLLTSNQWRPLMFGGNPLYPNNHRQERQQRERFGGSMSLSGDFTKEGLIGRFLPEDTTYEFAATYSQYVNEASRPEFIVSRLQNALRGYGGPGCNAIDRVPTQYLNPTTGLPDSALFDRTVGIQSDTAPGTNGCEYFNPFASSFPTSVVNGAPNPAFNGGDPAGPQSSYQNSVAMMDWLTHRRRYETTNQALTFDAVFTGLVPGFELPGGQIGWAVGSQWRQVESRGQPLGSEEDIQIAALDCPWGDQGLPPTYPGQSACSAQQGPFFGSGLGRQFPTFIDRQTISYFGELQLPVLDNLNFQLAARREEFGSIAGNIWKIAGKYDFLPELSFRASYSTNFQAPPEDIGILGVVQGGIYSGSLFRTVPTTTTTLPGITPEDDRALNLGVIYAPEVFGGQLRASVDFWEIIIDGEVADTNTTTVLANVFGTSAPSAATLANCSARFVNLVEFVQGSCVQGTSNGGSLTNIDRYTLNTGGFVTNGLDFNVDYTRPVGPGDIYASASATQVRVYKVKGFTIPGVQDALGQPLVYQQDFNGLGFANLTRAGTIMPEWRANASIGYSWDVHRVNLRANYVSGFVDESNPVQTGVASDGSPIFATRGLSASDYADLDFSWIYTPTWMNDLQLRLTVLNITDENPMPAQNTNAGGAAATRTGYYPGYGNPRGRQLELGLTKKF